uniref:multicopper oxidase family protein n=1 Tax=Haloprofundus sp. MHR1 TaxID=2572921 RepID=UPI001F3BE6FA|nr:multicopper oxidase family protein [Haloprofundus sp. MHR1]
MTNTTRRQALIASGIGLASLAGCVGRPSLGGSGGSNGTDGNGTDITSLPPDSADITQQIRATTSEYSPDGESLRTWSYNGRVPGPELRVSEGSRLRVDVTNSLPNSAETTVHWHGVPVRNPADGVPNVTQNPIATGETFSYVFDATPPGTYFYHSHVGLQLERQLLGPLIIEEKSPHVDYDRDVIVFFNDYLTTAPKPESEWRNSGTGGGGMGGMGGGGMMSTWRPPYAGHIVNGQGPSSPPKFTVSEGEQIRFRFINASGASTYRVGIGDHTMRISHADGRPVDPVEVDSFVFGAGERYDAIVTADEPGAWEIHGVPVDGDEAPARAVLQYDSSEVTTPTEPKFGGRELQYDDLQTRESLDAFSGNPDKQFNLTLSTGSEAGSWVIDGQRFPDADPLQIQEGDHVRVQVDNRSAMLHPMHLHGHFFRVGNALKDTVIVPSHMSSVTFDFIADNPGNWLFHCHNAYHLEGGMARVFEYQ